MSEEQRLEQRKTSAGILLQEIGMDYYDTESQARKVAEFAAEKLADAEINLLIEKSHSRDLVKLVEFKNKTITRLKDRLKGKLENEDG